MGLITNDLTVDEDPFDLETAWAEPKAKPLSLGEDPLVLSCGSYRLWKQAGSRWVSLEDVVPLPIDYEEADNLRKYYRERLVMDALKHGGETTSTFRKKLGKLVTNELELTNKDIGMLHRLPYFYEEDRAVDYVMETTDPITDYARNGAEQSHVFNVQKRVLRSRRAGDFYDYWMTTTTSNCPYMIVVKADNPLRGLMEDILNKRMELNARVWTKPMRGHYRNRYFNMVVFPGVA